MPRGYIRTLAPADGRLGALVTGASGSRLRIYPLPR